MSMLKMSARLTSYGSLVMLLAAAVLFLLDVVSLNGTKTIMTVATIIWFVTATPRIWKQ